MTNINHLKKDLQKFAKEIRDTGNYGTPKAMMTEQQIKKNTATLNCSGWTTEEIQTKIIGTPAFSSLIEKHDLRFFTFADSYGHNHIRLNYTLED